MLPNHRSTDARTHALAIRLARECRNIIQACLMESEWRDADMAFYEVIRAGLEEINFQQPPVRPGG
jgi:hypothetical protein